MASKGVSLLLVLCFIASALSLSCRSCDETPCARPNTLGCTAGFVDDVCGCCKVCAKDIGEDCKGPFESSGICAQGLECYIDESKFARFPGAPPPPGALFNAVGVCIETVVPPLPGCDARGEPTFCAFDLNPVCASNGVTYEGSCGFASAKCKNPGLKEIPCPPVRNDCDAFGEPKSCAFDLLTVCGSNGLTYKGSCEFASARCKDTSLERVPCVTPQEPTCAAPGSECAGGFCKEECDYENGEYNAPFNSCRGKDCKCCASSATFQCFGRGNPCEGVFGGTCRDQCEFDEVEQGFCTARVADVAQCVCCRKQNNNPLEFTLDGETFIVLSEHKGSTWQEAQDHCAKEGNYKLAEPALDVTRLASYLKTNYGSTLYWLGGQGEGFNRISYLSGQVIPTSSPLWRFNAQTGLETSFNHCMYIRDNGNPNPLGTYNCLDTQYMTPLCERTGRSPPPPPPPAAPAISFPGK